MRNRGKLLKIWLFALVSGCYLMASNAVTVIIPLRMVDQGLSYGTIGAVMASFSLGLLIIKLFIGRHSDMVGAKTYLLLAFFSGMIITLLLARSKTTFQYTVLLGLMGLSRGFFTSVQSAYIYELSSVEGAGKGFGNILGISSLLTALGGVLAGGLYKWEKGAFAFYIISIMLIISLVITWRFLPYTNKNIKQQKFIPKEIILKIDKKIILLCAVLFLQTFVTSPMWNIIIPMYFYKIYGFTAFALGIVMSLDEFIGSPVYMVGGFIADKISIRKMNCISFLVAGFLAILMLLSNQPFSFLISFLLCSIFVTGTYIGLPKAESIFVRERYKGFEFALISVSASAGDALGNAILGKIVEALNMQSGIVIFASIYFIITCLLFVGLKSGRENGK